MPNDRWHCWHVLVSGAHSLLAGTATRKSYVSVAAMDSPSVDMAASESAAVALSPACSGN